MRNSDSANSAMMEIEANKPSENGMVVGGLSPLSESLWKDKTNTEFVGDVSARLTWKDRSSSHTPKIQMNVCPFARFYT